MQTDADYPSDNGVDILNLANVGDNAFGGNTCMTSVNAPCSSLGPSFTASPNPIPLTGGSLGATTISWSAPDAQLIEIHIGSPSGPLFTQDGNRGSEKTGQWVSDGMTFYLQDVTGGKPLTADYTLAALVVHLQGAGHASLRNERFLLMAGVSAIPLLALVWSGLYWRRRSL